MKKIYHQESIKNKYEFNFFGNGFSQLIYWTIKRDHPNHPKGRNPYAQNVAICVKKKFNVTYKEIPDESFNEVVNYIEYLKKNPN